MKSPIGLDRSGMALRPAATDVYDLEPHHALALESACRCAEMVTRLKMPPAGGLTVVEAGNSCSQPQTLTSCLPPIRLCPGVNVRGVTLDHAIGGNVAEVAVEPLVVDRQDSCYCIAVAVPTFR
jgi:hypothetical protein